MPNRHVINEIIAAYANAALEGAHNMGGRDAVVEVRNQLIQILEFMSTNIKLRLSLDDEVYTPEQRKEIARNVFEGYNPILVELLGVMASRGDVEKLRRVYADYENLIVSKLDFNVVDVTTVVDLDDNLRTVIKNKIKNDLGRVACSSSIRILLSWVVSSCPRWATISTQAFARSSIKRAS